MQIETDTLHVESKR